MDFTPHSEKQDLAISSDKPIIMLGTGIQFGKGIPEDFPVLGPCGYREAKDIEVGDCLFDRDGKPTTVTGVFPQGEQDCYEIHFTDRKVIKTDGSHRNVIQRRSGRPECVISTEELHQSPYLWGKAQVPAAKPFDLPYNHHTLSPYIIGALLGDGCLVQGVNISNPDDGVMERITQELPDNLMLKHRENCDWSIIERERQCDSGGHGYSLACDEIRRLGLYGCKSDTKFIPDEYKYDGIDNRLDLLRGLMDTDGTVEQNKKMEYYTVSKRLAEDIVWLAESLGGKAWWTEKPHPKYTYKGEKRTGQLCYRLNLIMPHYNPFHLSRKAERYFVHDNTPNKVIKEVCRAGRSKTICFSVDSPTETYIIGNQVVTHNTKAGVITTAVAIGKYTSPDDNFLVTAPTYKILQQSTLPEFMRILGPYGELNKAEMAFHIHGGGTVWFRTMSDPDSIVGITNIRHVHADEAGLYSLYAWEQIQARASFKEAQIILTTSPYSLNWVYRELIRPKQRDPSARPDVELIQARSDENPFFPKKEFLRKKETMDPRRFKMVYGGEWGRMEGLVYDCFDEYENMCEPFALPPDAVVVAGLDWGYTHPFVLHVRAIVGDMHYQISETCKTGLTLTEIIEICRQKKSVWGIDRFYADPSQPGYIEELNRNGLLCIPADNDIRLGIEYHYELMKSRKYKIFKGTSPHTIDEYETYHWPEEKDLKPDDDDKERNPVKQTDDNCLVGETEVITPDGNKQIKDIVAGEKVLTPFGFKPVTSCGMTAQDVEIVRVKNLLCTRNHKVYSFRRGFISVDSLTPNDIVPTWTDTDISWVKSIVGMATIGSLHVASTVATAICTYWSGSITREIFRRATTSITKIMTFITTTYPTLPVLQTPCTSSCITAMFLKRENSSDSSTSIRSGHWLQPGTKAPKGGPGTRSKTQAPEERTSPASVFSVVKSSWQKPLSPNTARTIASLLTDATLVLMTLKQVALYVVRRFFLTSTSQEELAVQPVSKNQNVFNLTIDNANCFYANGLLVSNCDVERYISVMTYKTGAGKYTPKVLEEGAPAQEDRWQRMKRLRKLPRQQRSETWND